MPRVQKSNLPPTKGRAALCWLAMILAIAAIDRATVFAMEQNDGISKSAQRKLIDGLVEQLGDDDYHVRRLAQEQLGHLGFKAFDVLSEAEHHEDPEVAARVRFLLRLLQVDFADKNDSKQVQAILEKYRFRSAAEKIQQMRVLAGLPKGEGLAALCRLVRFQRSVLLSKHAACAILQCQIDNRGSTAQTAPLIRRQLGSSERISSRWLRESLRFSTEPKAALARWTELVQHERGLLGRGDGQTDREVVRMLSGHELHWIFALGLGNDEKAAAIKRLVSLRRSDTDTLDQLILWAVEVEAWKPLKQKPAEFAGQLARGPRKMLYVLAEAFAKQGQSEHAEQAAGRAFQLGDDGAKQQSTRLEMAYLLQKQGRFKWAEREYLRCLENIGANDETALVAVAAGSYLAEMLHDQGQNLRAAEVLGKLVKQMKEQKWSDDKNAKAKEALGIELKSMEARKGYLLAEHYKTQGDRGKQRQCLEEALAADPSEVDVLIACYRLPDSSAEFRNKVKKHIQETVANTRLLIKQNSGLPAHYNQLAWLVANTEGDLDEAIRFSKKSLQLQRNSGGYFDTLARCYFAKGDLKKAVEAQAKAAQLEPHSGLLAKQLEQFKKALGRQTNTTRKAE
jgi:tetratricopeptide (TPR) repeat protein